MTTSTAAHRLAPVHLSVQTSGLLNIFLRIPQSNQGHSLARQLRKIERGPTYGGALQRLAVGHGGVMHDDCIARGSLVCGILCKARLSPSFFRDSRLLFNTYLCTHLLWVISCHPTIPTSHIEHTSTNLIDHQCS